MYCNSVNNRTFQTTWGVAISIEVAIDAYERTPSAANYNLVNQLTTNFLIQNGSDWSSDPWNDDLAWMSRMCIRGYLVTGNANLLNAAKNNWNTIYNRGYNTTYGGGIWELMTTANAGTGSKSALATIPTVITGCLLYQATGDSTYLTKSQNLFAWVEQNLLDATTGQVNEGIHTAGLEVSNNVYNSGTFVNAANLLYTLTGNKTHYNDAVLAIDHVVNHITASGQPILTTSGNGTWASEFGRGLGYFCRDNNLWDKYYSWMVLNATSAWNLRRTDLNITWNQWATQTPQTDLHIMETLGLPDFLLCMPRHFEVETLTVPNYSGPDYRVFTESDLSGGAGAILDSTAVGNYLTFVLPNVGAGKYDVRVGVKNWGNRGIVQMAIGQAGNSSPSNTGSPKDLYSSSSQVTELDFGFWTPGTTGDKWVRFTVTGKNASSTGYVAAFDYIRLNRIK